MSRSASTATAATTASSNTSIWIVEIIGLPVRDDGETRAEVNFDVALNSGGGGLVGGAEKGIDASQHLASRRRWACRWRHMGELLEAGKRNDLTPLNLCIWVKSNPGMGSFYRNAHELCFVYKHGSATHINNFELGQYGRSRSNVWTYAGMNVFGKDRDALLTMHPTVKPLPLLIDMIKDVTKRGALIIDSSGSTLLAAEETGRIFAGVELDPGYVEVAIRRWQKRTGKDAMHAVTEDTFDEFCKRHAEVAAAPVSIVEAIESYVPDVMDHDSERSDD